MGAWLWRSKQSRILKLFLESYTTQQTAFLYMLLTFLGWLKHFKAEPSSKFTAVSSFTQRSFRAFLPLKWFFRLLIINMSPAFGLKNCENSPFEARNNYQGSYGSIHPVPRILPLHAYWSLSLIRTGGTYVTSFASDFIVCPPTAPRFISCLILLFYLYCICLVEPSKVNRSISA